MLSGSPLAVITLIPVGEVDGAALDILRRPLSECFATDVCRAPGLPLPMESWNRRREQYAAEIVLQGIADAAPGARTLGFVNVDLFSHGLAFVFGMADEGGRKAVVSLWRLRQELYYLPRDDAVLRRRLLTEAIHEIGHTFSMDHCGSSVCVMRFSNTLEETDAKGWRLCRGCREKLDKAHRGAASGVVQK
jgi:archaemetzincin